MESYAYPYPPPFSPVRPPEATFPDHGDGVKEYYELSSVDQGRALSRRTRSAHRQLQRRGRSRNRSDSPTRTRTKSKSRSASRSQSRSRSRTRSRSKSRSRSRSRSASASRKERTFREASFLDAFRVLYLTPSIQKRSTTKYLATKKKQDRIQEVLKSDGLGSKKWLFYPRNLAQSVAKTEPDEVPGSRDNCDQRVKIDGDFFRKYKRRSKVDSDAPIAKLKRWELIFYKKLGFIQAV